MGLITVIVCKGRGKKRGEKRRRGWGEREEKLLDHSLLPQNSCHQCWKPGSVAKQAVAGVKPWKKKAAVAAWAAGRELRDFTFNQKRTKPAKGKKKSKKQNKRGLIENVHVWRQPWIKRHSQLLLGWS